ncbi:hypothetical protein K438DRAFT_1825666 [Mycena galopus ATCC 62051]|nr:hypothetical protein K438DRAFT_1825666 [Mycena galopus ATCC 62051]
MDISPKVLVHRCDYRNEATEAAPTTLGMKYRQYSPAIPVYFLYTASPPPGGVQPVEASVFLASLRDKGDGERPIRVGILTPSVSALGSCSLPTDGLKF